MFKDKEMPEERKKVLFVFAHPDDEVVCGWPVLQHPGFDKELLLCASDRLNREKKWCANRVASLEALCRELRLAVECFDYSSGFSRYPQRHRRSKNIFAQLKRLFVSECPSLFKMAEHLRHAISSRSFDYIFTHNPWGEYGHMDHVVLHLLVSQLAAEKDYPMLQSDMHVQLNWLPGIQAPVRRMRWGEPFLPSCVCDHVFYERCKRFYTDGGVWTWSQEPQDGISIYSI